MLASMLEHSRGQVHKFSAARWACTIVRVLSDAGDPWPEPRGCEVGWPHILQSSVFGSSGCPLECHAPHAVHWTACHGGGQAAAGLPCHARPTRDRAECLTKRLSACRPHNFSLCAHAHRTVLHRLLVGVSILCGGCSKSMTRGNRRSATM